MNIRCLVSPIRQYSQELNNEHNWNRNFAADDTYRENFSLISKQLEKLLENLNVIFKKIGYSNSDIISKEKMIFNTLSDSITKFFNEAELEMTTLTNNNNSDQDALNRILEIIDDSAGVKSISDIYIRNAVLLPKNKSFVTSPKKPLSLLSKKKLLQAGKKFVYNAYIPKLLSFLNGCIQLRLLQNATNEASVNVPNSSLLSSLPSLELAMHYRNHLKDYQNDIDMVTRFIRKNKNELFYSMHFSDISNEMNKVITESIKWYKAEYRERLDKIVSMSSTISHLLLKLDVDSKADLDPQLNKIITTYSSIQDQKSLEAFLPVHKEIIQKVESALNKYQLVLQTREENRDILLAKCRTLWVKLKVPEDYIEPFLSQNSGLSLSVLRNLTHELEKMENMKKKLIKTLISESLQKIKELWFSLKYDDHEQAQFLCKFDSMKSSSTNLQDDEQLLELCECEVKELEKKMAIYKPVLVLIEEFKRLQADKLSLEESSKDSSRLLLRNSHKILLQEEKTRKKITRHFPRVIQELKEGLLKIEDIFGKPLNTDGENFMDQVTRQEEDLMSKYPRSRLNVGHRRVPNPSVSKPKIKTNLVEQRKRIQNNTSFSVNLRNDTSNIDMHQTPARKYTTYNKGDKKGLESVESSISSIRCMQGVRFSSPPKPLTKLLPPTFISRKSGSKIPEPRIKSFDSLTLASSPVFRSRNSCNKNETVRPTRLFPLSSSKVNQQKSQLPMLMKGASMFSKERPQKPVEKENVVNSTPRLAHSPDSDLISFSSPYREPNNSVYKLSVSPEGKCTLNIRENGIGSGLDDTSFMDEENDRNYVSWKKEQILKLKEHSNNE